MSQKNETRLKRLAPELQVFVQEGRKVLRDNETELLKEIALSVNGVPWKVDEVTQSVPELQIVVRTARALRALSSAHADVPGTRMSATDPALA